MEYYGYKDRGEAGTPIVDWGKIASDLTDKLVTVEAGREAKRKEIDDATNSFVKEIGQVDSGHSQSMGTFIQDTANTTKQYTLMQNKLLKAGKIDPNQYKMNLQNQKDSWSSLDGLFKKWNANFDNFTELSNKGMTGQQAASQMEYLGQIQELQNKKSFIDPASGNLYVAEYDKDGKIDTTKFRPQSASGMLRMTATVPLKVNVTAEVSKNNKIAEYKKATLLSNVEDPTARPEYKKLSDEIANSILSTNSAIGSVLMDTVGGYTDTYQSDPTKYTEEEKQAEKEGKLIKYKMDGTGNYNPADITDAQMTEAKNAIKNNLRSQLGYAQEAIRQPQPSGGGDGNGPTWKQQQDMLSKQVKVGNVMNLINPKTKKPIGKTVGFTNAIEKMASGITESTNSMALTDGKLTMKVISYKGSETEEGFDTDGMNKSTSKSSKPIILNEGVNDVTIDKKLKAIGFNSIQEAKAYLGGGSSSSGPSFESQYAKLKSGQTIVGPDGNTYQKP